MYDVYNISIPSQSNNYFEWKLQWMMNIISQNWEWINTAKIYVRARELRSLSCCCRMDSRNKKKLRKMCIFWNNIYSSFNSRVALKFSVSVCLVVCSRSRTWIDVTCCMLHFNFVYFEGLFEFVSNIWKSEIIIWVE